MNNKNIIRIIKIIISLSYCVIHQIPLAVLKVFNRKFPGTFVVLYYHEIKSIHKDNFSRQMAMLSKYSRPVRADSISFTAGEHRVAVTFDDAFQSVIENGFEAISNHKIPITIFVPTDYLGKQPGWEMNGDNEIIKEIVMTGEQIVKLPSELIMLGSHTCTHPELTGLVTEEIEKELRTSKDDLERLLGKEINLLAFPHGKFNSVVVSIALNAGYKYVYTIMPQFPKQNPESAIIGRTPVNPSDWDIEFRLKLSGYYCWLSLPGHIKRILNKFTIQ